MAHSSSISVSSPYTIFPLPQPLLQGNGPKKENSRRVYTTEVETSARKKRRRSAPEICAAIDGEGVNVYDISTTQTIASHVLPPETKFSCPPTSVRLTVKKDGSYIRQTYGATLKPKRQIVGWTESPETAEDGVSEMRIRSLSTEIESSSPIILLKRLGARRKTPEGGYVLAVHANGTIKGYFADLAEEKWTFELSKEEHKVKFAQIAPLSTFQQSILKERPDVIIGEREGVTEDYVLFTVSTSGTSTSWEVHLVLLPPAEPSTVLNLKARTLLEFTLPEDGGAPNSFSKFTAHFESGTLHKFVLGEIRCYNLLSTVPTVVSKLRIPQSLTSGQTRDNLNLVQLSPSVVMVTTEVGISLYDTRYSSVQAKRQYSQSSGPGFGCFYPTTWLEGMNMVIGYSVAGIMAVQLGRKGSRSAISGKESLLIDSVCRGLDGLAVQNDTTLTSNAAGLSQKVIKQRNAAHFSKTQKEFGRHSMAQLDSLIRTERQYCRHTIRKLDALAQKNDVKAFEELFGEFANIKRPDATPVTKSRKPENEKPVADESTTASFGDADIDTEHSDAAEHTLELREYILPETSRVKEARHAKTVPIIPYEMAVGVLKCIFEVSPEDGKLFISFFPPNVFRYLIISRNFNTTLLSAVKRAHGGMELDPGELVDCLVEHDPQLDLLAWVLQEVPEFEIGDVVRAIKEVMNRMFCSEEPIPAETEDEEMDLTGELSPEMQLQRETRKAEWALENAERAMEEGANREIILRIALGRLNTFPSDSIIKHLKDGLDGEQLLTLIRMLRKELIIDRDESLDEPEDGIVPALQADSPENAGLICDLLTCCLDAVGLTGLILANEPTIRGMAVDDDLPEDNSSLLIDSLHYEVQKSVAALETSADLSLFLGELVRHATLLNPDWQKKAAESTKALEANAETTKALPAPELPAPEEIPSTTTISKRSEKKSARSAKIKAKKDRIARRPGRRQEQLARRNMGRIPKAERRLAAQKARKVQPEQVTAIRKMVAEMLPMFGASRDAGMKTRVGKRELALGVVGGRSRYAVEKVDV